MEQNNSTRSFGTRHPFKWGICRPSILIGIFSSKLSLSIYSLKLMLEITAFDWLPFRSLYHACWRVSTFIHSLIGVSTIPAYFIVVALPLSSMITHGSFYRLPCEQLRVRPQTCDFSTTSLGLASFRMA